MEFLRSFLERHLAGKPMVASQNVGCYLRLGLVLDSGKCFWILGHALDSGKCFWILGRILDSGKCF